jgi:hypothetical protein
MLELCRTAALLAGLFSVAAACAPAVQTTDLLHSPECAAAREALAGAQQDALARTAEAKDKLAVARKRAQLACLGPENSRGERVGAPDPPIAVPPPVIEATPPQHAAIVVPPAPPPALAIPRLSASITSCDPGGCWDSEGRRLNQVGPMLVGPRGGACAVQGGVVQCP